MKEAHHLECDFHTESYGKDQYQKGDLYLPKHPENGTVCLFHGGFWKMPYDRTQLSELAEAIAANGFTVWNIEYRRTGWKGGGYPGTFDDAVDAVNYLTTLKKKPLYVAGHSAGGHLALWLGNKGSGVAVNTLELTPTALIGLAPVTDLLKCYGDQERSGYVLALMNQTPPSEAMDKYQRVSPISLIPMAMARLVIHGSDDASVPVEESEAYASASKAAGDEIELIKIEGGSHMDFTNPESRASKCLIERMTAYGKTKRVF